MRDYQGIFSQSIDPFTVDIFMLAKASQSVYPKHYGINSPAGGVPAQGAAEPVPSVLIPNNIVFWCWGITGAFTTISGGADVGTSQVSIEIEDTGKDVFLTNRPINLDLMVSPGRVRNPTLAGDPSHQVFYPGFLNHIWLPNSDISVPMTSTALVDANEVRLDFFGFNFVVNTGTFEKLSERGKMERTPRDPRGVLTALSNRR